MCYNMKKIKEVSMKKEYIISKENSGQTVRDFLRSTLGFSARTLKNLKYNGNITADGKAVHANFVLQENAHLVLEFPDEVSETITPEDIPINIIYEDDDFLAVNKPYGMPSHPSQNHHLGTLANAVMFKYRHTPFVYRVLTRLDIDTTGVVIIAKNAVFANSFQKCDIKKEYLAVCVGSPCPKKGTIEAPIGRAEGIIKRCVTKDGKPSLTEYEVLDENDSLSLVRAVPITGRTHQIRVHMAHIGCPLLGDYLYGKEIPGERTRLHCEKLTFIHPMTGKVTVLTAKVPDDIKISGISD